MEYKLNILQGLHWYRHEHNILTPWTPLRTTIVTQFFMGITLSADDAEWITDQINTQLLNRLEGSCSSCST